MENFLAGSLIKTPWSLCRGHRFDPWSGNPPAQCHQKQNKNKNPKKQAKTNIKELINTSDGQVSDSAELESIIDNVLSNNQSQIEVFEKHLLIFDRTTPQQLREEVFL